MCANRFVRSGTRTVTETVIQNPSQTKNSVGLIARRRKRCTTRVTANAANVTTSVWIAILLPEMVESRTGTCADSICMLPLPFADQKIHDDVKRRRGSLALLQRVISIDQPHRDFSV